MSLECSLSCQMFDLTFPQFLQSPAQPGPSAPRALRSAAQEGRPLGAALVQLMLVLVPTLRCVACSGGRRVFSAHDRATQTTAFPVLVEARTGNRGRAAVSEA